MNYKHFKTIFETEYFFNLLLGVSQIWYIRIRIRILIGKNNCDLETSRKSWKSYIVDIFLKASDWILLFPISVYFSTHSHSCHSISAEGLSKGSTVWGQIISNIPTYWKKKYIGSSNNATFGSWKKSHKISVALSKFSPTANLSN